tara:strand:- start:60 stop:1211 length:1152 start_codon:yes stop_codon:yes gene_type:complete
LILHRAFYREVLQNTGAVGLLILFVFLVIRVVGFLRLAAEGIIPTNSVLLLILLRLISHLDIIVPLAVFVAMLLVLGRWARDRELIAAAAAGIGISSFIRPTLSLSCVLGIFVAVFSLYLSPLAVQKGDSVQHEFRLRSDVTAILPGVFTENVGGDGVYFVETHNSDTNTYHNIFAWGGVQGVESVVVAASAQHLPADDENVINLELNDGARYDVTLGETVHQSITFKRYVLSIDNRGTPATRNRLEAWPLYIHEIQDSERDLFHHVGKRPDGTKGDITIRSELHWRLSKIVLLPVIMFLALALGYGIHGRARTATMVVALVTYFAYATIGGYLVAYARNIKGDAPLISLWIVHAVFLALAIYVFQRRSRNLNIGLSIYQRND